MSATLAIASREYTAFWRTSTGWIVTAILALLTAFVLSVSTLQPTEVASMRAVFTTAHWVLLIACPAVSMRLLSEESRIGTLDSLMGTPASDWAIAAGKFFAAIAMISTALAATLPSVVVLAAIAPIEPSPLIAGYLGVILTAGLYLATGLLCSALTQSQVTAFLATVLIMTAWNTLPLLSSSIDNEPLESAVKYINIQTRLESFAKGLIDSADVIFFLTAWWAGIACTVAALSWRRWA